VKLESISIEKIQKNHYINVKIQNLFQK